MSSSSGYWIKNTLGFPLGFPLGSYSLSCVIKLKFHIFLLFYDFQVGIVGFQPSTFTYLMPCHSSSQVILSWSMSFFGFFFLHKLLFFIRIILKIYIRQTYSIMDIYVYMYINIRVRVCVYICINVYIYMYIYTVSIYIYIHTHKHMYIYTITYACTHMYNTHICTHIHMHTYTDRYTHICMCVCLCIHMKYTKNNMVKFVLKTFIILKTRIT